MSYALAFHGALLPSMPHEHFDLNDRLAGLPAQQTSERSGSLRQKSRFLGAPQPRTGELLRQVLDECSLEPGSSLPGEGMAVLAVPE